MNPMLAWRSLNGVSRKCPRDRVLMQSGRQMPGEVQYEVLTMTDQIALITGSNKGIGFAIAQQLANAGYSVWLGCRDLDLGEQAAAKIRNEGLAAKAVRLDVTDDGSVREAFRQLETEAAALHVLVNNAGLMFGSGQRASEEPIDEIRQMLEVNALAPLRVTQAFLPLLRKAQGARVVMMSSGLSSLEATADITSENWTVGYAGYCASKTALNMLTLKLAKDLIPEGIKVNAADPGLTATDMTGHMGNRTPAEAARIAVYLATLGPLGPAGGFFHDGNSDPMPRHRW